MDLLDRPIVILGAARSGTKVIPGILGRHPDVAYWVEPNYIWKYKNASLGHDMIPASRATPEICRQIRERFRQFVEAEGKTRFCEKTPSNTLRLPFVLKVLPDARIVHIIRDGRDVALSARAKWMGKDLPFETETLRIPSRLKRLSRRTIRRIRAREIPVRDLPYYLGGFAKTYLRRLGVGGTPLWGPRFPGIQTLVKQYSLLEVCAIQWRWSIESVLNCVDHYKDQIYYLELKYEDLCAEPLDHLKRIYDFLELDAVNVEEMAGRIKAGNTSRWKRDMTADELETLDVHIGHTLQQLGYES